MVNVQNFGAVNQFDISDNGKRVFQSYSSTIFVKEDHTLRVGKNFDYSRTTSKYAKRWLGENTCEDVEKLWKFMRKEQSWNSETPVTLDYEGYTIIFDSSL